MQESVTAKTSSFGSHGRDDLIAGKSISFYWQAARLFIVLLLFLEILNIIQDINKHGHWIIEVVVFLLFNWWIFKRWKLDLPTMAVASIFLGVLTGLSLAMFEIIWYHQWWYTLNIIRQPFIIGLVGTATSLLFSLLFQNLKFNKNKKDQVKKTGIYGRKESNHQKYR